MSATVTNTTLSTTFTPSEIETNFQDLTNKFGNINNADIAASAGIIASKLASRRQEVYIQLICRTGDGWPGGDAIVDAVPIPGTEGDEAWTATDISWVCSDIGSSDGVFSVVLSTFSGGTWVTPDTTVLGNTTIDSDQGKALEGGSVSIGYGATAKSIALKSVTAGTGVLTGGNNYDFLRVTVRLVRDIQGA